MKNQNRIVLLAAIALIVLVIVAGQLVAGQKTVTPTNDPLPTAKAYLRVKLGEEYQPLIPLTENGEIVFESDDKQNVIHTTETSAVMYFSTCHNQDCVKQGEVSLDNIDERILGNMIVCLPNEVLVELLTPEEVGIGNGE